jgi:hypothetical protein
MWKSHQIFYGERIFTESRSSHPRMMDMDLDFELLATNRSCENEELWIQLLPRFEHPQFMLAMIQRIEQDPPPNEGFIFGVLLSIARMVRIKFNLKDSDDDEFWSRATQADLAPRLLELLFRLPVGHRPRVQDTLRLLVIRLPLGDCARHCIEVFAGHEVCDYLTAWTAVGFLANYLHFYAGDRCEDDLAGLSAQFVAVAAQHLLRFRNQDFTTFADFVALCCRCLAALFSLHEQTPFALLTEVDNEALAYCFECGLQVIATPVDEDHFRVIKTQARIVKAFSNLLCCLPYGSEEDPFIVQLCTTLVDLSFQMLLARHPVILTNALLVLLDTIMTSLPLVCPALLRGFDAPVLFAAARLTEAELKEFDELPELYLDFCLLFSCETDIRHCPRSTLSGIFSAMSPEDLATTAERIVEAGLPSDPAGMEIWFFLMNLVASSDGCPPSVDQFLYETAEQLSPDMSLPSLAGFLTCLSSVELEGDRHEPARAQLSAAAHSYFEIDCPVVQHAALKLFWRNFDIDAMDAELSRELATLLVGLTETAWHPHLVPIFSRVVNVALQGSPENAHGLFDWLFRNWSLSYGRKSCDFVALLRSVIRVLPNDSEMLYQAACILGCWFHEPNGDLCHRDVMTVALAIARRLPVLPPEFFNVLPFCDLHIAEDNQWITPFSEMCVTIAKTSACFHVEEAYPVMCWMCAAFLGNPKFAPRMLIVFASFLQTRGPAALDIVAETLPIFRGSEPGTPIWSAALVVVLSGVIVCGLVPERFGELFGPDDLGSWYAFALQAHRLHVNRVSVMSIAGFMVLAAAGDPQAFGALVAQLANLTACEPDGPDEPLERLFLPFDTFDLVSLVYGFHADYPQFWDDGSLPEICSTLLSVLRDANERPGFWRYLSDFNPWWIEAEVASRCMSDMAPSLW